jgi:RND family efflux transporter MFP subunit
MKSLKKYSVLTVAVLFLAACGNKPTDKKAELDLLLKQQNELAEKISTLKSEMEKAGDTSLINTNIKTVALKEMTATPFSHYVEVQAKVDASQSVSATAKMGGTVTSILVSEGDKVAAGQVLAKLDDVLIKQSIAELQTQIDFATNIYKKQKALWDQQIGSEVQYLTAKNNKESLENKMKSAREQWSMTEIKAPISGTVDAVPIKIGQAIMPGIPCFNIVNLSGLKIKAEVAEAYISKIKTGDNVIVSIPDLKLDLNAKVSFTSSSVNPMSRTFTVEVKVPANVTSLRPNMIAVMKIADYNSVNAMVVPINVVQSSSDGNYVLTAITENGKNIVTKKVVQTGLSYNGSIEVLSGLTAGDKIIIAGYQDVNPGEDVKF